MNIGLAGRYAEWAGTELRPAPGKETPPPGAPPKPGGGGAAPTKPERALSEPTPQKTDDSKKS